MLIEKLRQVAPRETDRFHFLIGLVGSGRHHGVEAGNQAGRCARLIRAI
jgi:hypothetical protein